MSSVIEGNLTAKGRRFGLVAARTNDLVVARLLDGAIDALRRHGAAEEDIVVVRTPGAWEIPLALRDLARVGRFDGLVALGAVLRGGTPHFEYISAEVTKGIFHVSMEVDIPIALGVLTCDTLEQGLERAGAKSGNKGFDAALSVIESVDLRTRLKGSTGRKGQ